MSNVFLAMPLIVEVSRRIYDPRRSTHTLVPWPSVIQSAAPWSTADHPSLPFCPHQIWTTGQEYGPFCGSSAPGRIDTGSYRVHVSFRSDRSGKHKGWKIKYTSNTSD